MTRRYVLWGIGVPLIVVGSAYAWTAWARWSAIELPVVGVERPEVAATIDPDAPILINVERMVPLPSATLGDMLREADAVLVVQLGTDVTERHVTEWKDGPPTHRTIYSFTVRQAIKGAMRPGEIVRIAREGGRQSFEDDFPRPGIGQQFVVFLKWWPEVGAYRNHYGPLTTFRVVNFRVYPMGQFFQNQVGRQEDDFVRELAMVAKQQGR